MQRFSLSIAWIVLLTGAFQTASGRSSPAETGSVKSSDGVEIRYSVSGSGQPELVFIHGGFADRSFWVNQIAAFSKSHRVITLDTAGHGESGVNRAAWTLEAFGGDVVAVMEKENVRRAVLIGNSMGGPIALEAARLAPGRVVGVIGIDTFQDLTAVAPGDYFEKRAKAFRDDFPQAMKEMVRMLFHKDADQALMAEVERKMLRSTGERAAAMIASFKGYDQARAAREAKAPIRAINGDLFPTEALKNRSIGISFEAVVLPHVGHYPMLETPALFNRVLAGLLTEWK